MRKEPTSQACRAGVTPGERQRGILEPGHCVPWTKVGSRQRLLRPVCGLQPDDFPLQCGAAIAPVKMAMFGWLTRAGQMKEGKSTPGEAGFLPLCHSLLLCGQEQIA